MQADDQERLLSALRFAMKAHGNQTRKGKKDVPYVSHLLQVCGLALEYGQGSSTLSVAAILHDVVEDGGAPVARIRDYFGPEVARIVESCSDLLEGDTPSSKSDWDARKKSYIEHLGGAPYDSRLVSACDKLHNLTNIVADLRAEGPDFLDRFTATREQTVWYYKSLRSVLGEDLPSALLKTFDTLLSELEARSGT